jgi:hypothetical protein
MDSERTNEPAMITFALSEETNTTTSATAGASDWDSLVSTNPDIEQMSREDAKRGAQAENMREAHSLAESMEELSGEHPNYCEHFTALVQDLRDAGKHFTDKRAIVRMQLMTEAMSGMFTICAMFEDLRSRSLKVKSADDPVTGSVFFEHRLLKTIKYLAKELHEFTETMTTGTTNIPYVANEQVRTTGPATALVANADIPLLASVDASTGKYKSDEEIARELQDQDDAAYAKLLAKQVYYYRQPVGGAVPAVVTTAATTNGAATGPVTSMPTPMSPVDDQEVEAFINDIADTA